MKARVESTKSITFSMFDTVSRPYIVTLIVHEFRIRLLEMMFRKYVGLTFDMPLTPYGFLNEFLITLHIRTLP